VVEHVQNVVSDQRGHVARDPATRHEHSESPPDDLLKVPEAAKRLGVNPETLYRLIKAGNFPPAIRIGASIRVSVPRLERFLHGDGT